MIRNAVLKPNVIRMYLETPPTRETLVKLIADMGISVRDVLRKKRSHVELGLDDAKWSDERLIDFMMQHPILINRPIVVTESWALSCVAHLKRCWIFCHKVQQGAFTKEDGEKVDAKVNACLIFINKGSG